MSQKKTVEERNERVKGHFGLGCSDTATLWERPAKVRPDAEDSEETPAVEPEQPAAVVFRKCMW